MAQLSIATRFNSWRELMTAVKAAVAELGTDARPLNKHNRGAIQSSLQVLDTVAATLIDEQQEALALGARQLEEAAVLLCARGVGLALAETPIVFASESEIGEIQTLAPRGDGLPPEPIMTEGAWQPEADRGFLQDMVTPPKPLGNVLPFTGVQLVRQDQGGSR